MSMQVVCGVEMPAKWSQYHQQMYLFYYGNLLLEQPYWRQQSVSGISKSKTPYMGEGRYEHFRKLVELVFPKIFEWNPWTEQVARALCENKHLCVCGCGGSGKSTVTGMYAFFWYLAQPNNSAVLIASTTIEAAKKRIWKEIRKYYVEFTKQIQLGNTVIVNSPKPAIRASQQDTAHGIYVVAVAKGEEQKGIDSLKGFHPERILMIGDETDSISQAVVDVGANQEIGTIEYQTVWLGNDPSLFNPLGKMMQPEPNKAVGLEHTEWTSVSGYHCMRLDAYDSPNIRDKDKWKGIIRQKDIDDITRRFGENSPQVWIMLRGIHPPEGADNTILTESLFLLHGCAGGVVWKRGFKSIAMLDPAFGGDRCVIRKMDYGEEQGTGQIRVLIGPPVEFRIDASDNKTPAEHQIAKKVRNFCESNGISPQDFYMDRSGTGRGTWAVLVVEWSPNINGIEFGGAPSTMPVSDDDPIPANEAYDRKVTELWYSFRVFVRAGMIRGLDIETTMEFCSRQFFVKAKKTAVETKPEMKKRGAPSPDLADCVVIGIEALRQRGINATITSDVKQEFAQDYSQKFKAYDLDAEGTYERALDDSALTAYMD